MPNPDVCKEAMNLASLGWRVIPLRPRDKRPPVGFSEWQRRASCDEEQVLRWWDQYPEANLGVVWGPGSGVIDVECDSDDGNRRLIELCGGDALITPTYRSKKGVHRVFRFDPGHPFAGFANKRYPGILPDVDIKCGGGGGSYSVAPPSLHPSGARYEWLPGLSPFDVDPVELPLMLVAAIEGEEMEPRGAPGRSPEELGKHLAGEGVSPGNRNDWLTSTAGTLLRDAGDMSDPREQEKFLQLVRGQNALLSSPLPDTEVRQVFHSIWRREQKQRENEVDPAANRPQFDPRSGKAVDQDWQLVKITTEPPTWKLYAPLWSVTAKQEDKRGRYILLSTEQLGKPSQLALQAMAQADTVIDARTLGRWAKEDVKRKIPSKLQQLFAALEFEDPPSEMDRTTVVAEQVVAQLRRHRTPYDADKQGSHRWQPFEDGSPREDPAGSVWLRFAWLRAQIARDERDSDAANRPELSRLLCVCGAEDRFAKSEGGGRSSWKVLTRSALKHLERLAAGGEEEEHEQDRHEEAAA